MDIEDGLVMILLC